MTGSVVREGLSADEYARMRSKAMTEAQLQAVVLAAAKATGWLAYHTHDSRRSQPGFPDLVLVRGPRLLFRELKTTTGAVRVDQHTWLHALGAAGGDAAIWRPLDWYDGTIGRALAGARDEAQP